MTLFEAINVLATIDDDEREVVMALAEFQKYLSDNMGEKINLSTVAEFAQLVGSIVDAIDE